MISRCKGGANTCHPRPPRHTTNPLSSLSTPSSDRENIQLTLLRATSQSWAHEKRDTMTPSAHFSIASQQHCANSHADLGRRHDERQGTPSSHVCPPRRRRRRLQDRRYRLATGMILHCPVGTSGTRNRIDPPPRQEEQMPLICVSCTDNKHPLSTPLLDREYIQSTSLTLLGMAKQSLPSPALSRAHKKRATTRSSVEPIAIGTEDINRSIVGRH